MQGKSIFNNKFFLVFVLLVVLCTVFSVISYVKYADYANKSERAIVATDSNNQNIQGTCTNNILEIAQVPGMYRNDLIKVIEAEMKNRYSGNSGQVANFIQERAQNFDSTLYTRIQNEMTACANRFSAAQTKLIDQTREYETNMGNQWSGMWIKMAGYPKINLKDYAPVVAEDTKEIFQSRVRKPIRLENN